jgi:prevent-host-death family protein
MKKVGAFEAKTHFSELLRQVEAGESIEITKNNRKVALLVPCFEEDAREKAIRNIKTLRQGIKLGPSLSIRKLRDEGRM